MRLIKRLTFGLLLLTCLTGLTTVNSEAQVQWKKFSYFLNNGGLNDNLSSTEIADNEASDIQNVIFDTGGALKKRYGFLTIPPNPLKVSTGTTVCVNGLYFYKKDDGTRYLIALSNSDSLPCLTKKNYQSGGGPVAGAWDYIPTSGFSLPTYTNNIQPSFTTAQNALIFTDGVPTDKPQIWNGITATAGILTTNANLPQGTYVVYHKNILFVANSTAWPSRVWFSNLDDIYTWTATDFFDVQTSDGSQVRGMISAFDSLYVFKDRSIWRLSGTNRDDFALQKMVDGIGTLSNASIKVVNNFIYFTTAQNDVAVYDGAYTVQFISQKIRGTIGGLSFNRSPNTCGASFSSYKYNDYDYYCAVSNSPGATNNLMLVFDTAYKAWTKFSGLNANCMTVADNSNTQNSLYFGDYSGYVHQYPSTSYYDGNIATSAIVAYYQTKWFRYPEMSLGDKYWRLLKTYTLSESSNGSSIYLTADCKSDFEVSGKLFNINITGSGALWDSAVWDTDIWAGTTILVGRNEVEKGVSMFQIKYSNINVNEGFTIVGFENFIEGSERI